VTLRQRQPRVTDPAFLAFVRTKPCCVCVEAPPSQAAHIRMSSLALGKRECGKGEKPDDKWSVPLCPLCHLDGDVSVHRVGEEWFWRIVGLNPFAIAALLYAEFEAIRPRKRRGESGRADKASRQRGFRSAVNKSKPKRKWATVSRWPAKGTRKIANRSKT
jgi:hypothetical protein